MEKNKAILTYCQLTNGEIKAFSNNLDEITKRYANAYDYCKHVSECPQILNVEWGRTLDEIGHPYYSFQKKTLDGVFKIIPGKENVLIDNNGIVIDAKPEDGDMIFATKDDAEMVMKTLKAERLTSHINDLIASRNRLRAEVKALNEQIDAAVVERNSLF